MYGNGDSFIQNSALQSTKQSDAVYSDQDIPSLVGLGNLKNYLKNKRNLTLKTVSRAYLLRIEKKLLKKALEKTNWNRKKAAGLLDISYKSLLNKIKEYEIA